MNMMPKPTPSPTGLRILLVDDDQAVRQLIAEALVDAGHHVAEADRSAPALAFLKSETFDLMITDLGLPGGMTGQQLAVAALALQPALKLIAITGYPDQAVMLPGLQDGELVVLAKPFTLQALCERVAALVG